MTHLRLTAKPSPTPTRLSVSTRWTPSLSARKRMRTLWPVRGVRGPTRIEFSSGIKGVEEAVYSVSRARRAANGRRGDKTLSAVFS